MLYKFEEPEHAHAVRLGGNVHRTRQVRRAIMHILTGHIYSELAWYLVAKGLGELMKMAAVKLLDTGLLVPHGKPSDVEFLLAKAGQLASTADPDAPQLKRAKMIAQGLFPGTIPYPYAGSHGVITVDDRARQIVASTFEIRLDGGSYQDVADTLNLHGHKTSTGRKWNKDTVRTFCQNPIHAGFTVSYKDRLRNGSANKRGGLILTRLVQGFPEPLIDMETWLVCNPVMAEREIIQVFPEVKRR